MSIKEQARRELALINFGDEDTAVMLDILDRFFDQWDSGGAVWAVAPVLQRCIAGKPLSPLTGADSEWMEVGEGMWQNVRCSSVFKDATGRAYDIDVQGRPTITFPYDPEHARVPDPAVVFQTDSERMNDAITYALVAALFVAVWYVAYRTTRRLLRRRRGRKTREDQMRRSEGKLFPWEPPRDDEVDVAALREKLAEGRRRK
jgi:hypothetical protein